MAHMYVDWMLYKFVKSKLEGVSMHSKCVQFVYTLFTLLFLSLALPLGATPNHYAQNRCMFIGTSKWHYFVLEAIHENPGSHYSFNEKLVLNKYKIRTDELVETYVICHTKHVDRTTNGDWISQDVKVGGVGLNKVLSQNKVVYGFPEPIGPKWSFFHRKSGITMEGKYKSFVVVPADRLKELKSACRPVKIVDLFRSGKGYFVLLRWEDEDLVTQETIKYINHHKFEGASIKIERAEHEATEKN